MSQFDQPASVPTDAQPWRWRLEDASGADVTVADEFARRSFASQADAESWVGEFYLDLLDEGVAAVTLFEVDRAVYGPMSLEA